MSDQFWYGLGCGMVIAMAANCVPMFLNRLMIRESARAGWSCRDLLDFLDRNE